MLLQQLDEFNEFIEFNKDFWKNSNVSFNVYYMLIIVIINFRI